MIGRIVEVATDQRHLSVHRGFLVVKDTVERREIAQLPIDDVAAVIANAHGLSYSNNLLVALAQRGAPFVLCGSNHNPVGILLPIEGNFQQAKRFDAQLAASKPLNKRLWATLVRAKIQGQASVLLATNQSTIELLELARRIRSGDPNNLEAQAAKKYWASLWGNGFRRDRSLGGINAMLNYGYTVLRAATARAVVAAGLHPTKGIHHSNENNAMRLVDDLMEPFRPLIDLAVWRSTQKGHEEVTPETKRILVLSLFDDLKTSSGSTPVSICLERLATSLALVYVRERTELELPEPFYLPEAIQDPND